MAGEPIALGTSRQNILVPGVGSQITTNEFGVQRGTIRYQVANQNNAQGLRLVAGTSYNGKLLQFSGFLVDKSGDILGEEGKAAYVDVSYARLDPRFVLLPVRSNDIAYIDIETDKNSVLSATTLPGIPVPHPTLNYKFSDTQAQNTLGKFGVPPNAPKVAGYNFDQRISGYKLRFFFNPNPSGWVCLKDDSDPICGGKLFEIDQQWKLFMGYAGFSVLGR